MVYKRHQTRSCNCCWPVCVPAESSASLRTVLRQRCRAVDAQRTDIQFVARWSTGMDPLIPVPGGDPLSYPAAPSHRAQTPLDEPPPPYESVMMEGPPVSGLPAVCSKLAGAPETRR